jgi:uncharacterized protein YcbX
MTGGALGAVDQLWRYPVSSLGGEALDNMSVDLTGVAGDRRFGLVDTATDAIAAPDGSEKWAMVPRIRARLYGRLEVAVPGGDFLAAPDPRSDSAISAFLGFDAAIRPFSHDVAPGYSGPLTGARYREAPVHLLTTASLARLKALHPSGEPDPRRFRPNILVDMPAVEGSFPETEWIGRRLAIGDVELTISEPCRRCGFTILAQNGFDADAEILRQLVRNNQRNIGVYCTVDRPGTIRRGDAMRLLE